MAKRKPKSPMTEPLRKAIIDSGIPMLTLEQKTGVKRQSIMKFVKRETSLRLDVADKLAKFFGLELQPAKKRKGR